MSENDRISEESTAEMDSSPLNNMERLEGFRNLYLLAQVVGVIAVLMMFFHAIIYGGGFGFHGNPGSEFNWHPFLMTLGLIFLFGNSIMVFRAFRTSHKSNLKLTHASLHILTTILTVLGALAVLDTHLSAHPPVANFYTLHSWIGLLAVLLYVIQLIAGLIVFFNSNISDSFKIIVMPFHVYYGHLIFIFAIAAALIGINEYCILHIGAAKYAELGVRALWLNLTGLLIAIFGAIVVYLTTNIFYKRHPRPEDQALLK